jgi:hypothetical protein
MHRLKNAGTTDVEVHGGKAIVNFAQTYYSLSASIKEIIQNKLDNGAKRIVATIDLKNRTLEILGDGLGSSEELFKQAMKNVCNSIKGGIKSKKYGRFGLGFFSPTDKCREFTFTAYDPHAHKTLIWIFNRKKIEPCHTVKVPTGEVEPLSNGFTTRISMFDIIEDRSRTRVDLDSLAKSIATEYSVGLERNNAKVELVFIDEKGSRHETEVVPSKFSGHPIDPVEYEWNKEQSVEFHLFVAPLVDSKRRGQVIVGIKDDPFRLKFRDVVSKTDHGVLNSDAFKALVSGAFNGEIISKGCELATSRTSFRKNDSLEVFCTLINNWWTEIGEKEYERIKVEEETNRFQNLGKKALENMTRILSSPSLKNIRDLINQFKVGRIGAEHADVPRKIVKGKQEAPSISATIPDQKSGGSGKSGEKSSKPKEHKSHMPLSVTGNRGNRRTEVYDNSLGLQISHSEISGSKRMYEFDSESGILDINILHPNWEALEESDSALIEYQIQCLFTALVLADHPEKDTIEQYEIFAEPILNLTTERLKLE